MHHANTLLKHKVLFGTDFPFITPERWMSDFEQAGFRDEVKPLILKQNAARRLATGAAHDRYVVRGLRGRRDFERPGAP